MDDLRFRARRSSSAQTMETDHNRPYQSLEIASLQAVLSSRLKEFVDTHPEYLRTHIDILDTVDDRIDGQLKERLEQAKTNHTGTRIVLILYNVGQAHWTGIMIKFKTNEEIENAGFIDPVKDSTFDVEKLQKLFIEVFPHTILRSRPVQYQIDRSGSGRFISQSLVEMALLCESTEFELLPAKSSSASSSPHIGNDGDAKFSTGKVTDKVKPSSTDVS